LGHSVYSSDAHTHTDTRTASSKIRCLMPSRPTTLQHKQRRKMLRKQISKSKSKSKCGNDVLPLKAGRRDVIANLISFWGTGTSATKL